MIGGGLNGVFQESTEMKLSATQLQTLLSNDGMASGG